MCAAAGLHSIYRSNRIQAKYVAFAAELDSCSLRYVGAGHLSLIGSWSSTLINHLHILEYSLVHELLLHCTCTGLHQSSSSAGCVAVCGLLFVPA